MSQKIILGSFAREEQLLDAVRAVRKHNWEIVDVYAPYPLHGMEELLGWRRSRLPVACFFGRSVGFWVRPLVSVLDVGPGLADQCRRPAVEFASCLCARRL